MIMLFKQVTYGSLCVHLTCTQELTFLPYSAIATEENGLNFLVSSYVREKISESLLFSTKVLIP